MSVLNVETFIRCRPPLSLGTQLFHPAPNKLPWCSAPAFISSSAGLAVVLPILQNRTTTLRYSAQIARSMKQPSIRRTTSSDGHYHIIHDETFQRFWRQNLWSETQQRFAILKLVPASTSFPTIKTELEENMLPENIYSSFLQLLHIV